MITVTAQLDLADLDALAKVLQQHSQDLDAECFHPAGKDNPDDESRTAARDQWHRILCALGVI